MWYRAMMKDYPYIATDGKHWPDAYIGSELVYSLDFTSLIPEALPTMIADVTWDLPKGLKGTEAFEDNHMAHVKILAEEYGSHKVTCSVRFLEDSYAQVYNISMILKVM